MMGFVRFFTWFKVTGLGLLSSPNMLGISNLVGTGDCIVILS
jgi:hypothetical protein